MLSEAEATNEARQPGEKPKSDRVIDDKSEGVKFYELDDEVEILPNGKDEPVPEVTMPSYKKRVHSQRIPRSERAVVTPYEGAYDEKYSSDEDNIEYEVCEPEDLTERSNSTVTFSEDLYDSSDAIDEILRNQIRKPSQEDVRPSRSILKAKGAKKGDGVGLPGPDDKSPQTKHTHRTVSPADRDAKPPEPPATPGVDDTEKSHRNLEPLQSVITDTDKESSAKGERIPPQSTLPQQIDQITDSSATNKRDLAKSDQKIVLNVTKPLQDALSSTATETAEPFQVNTLTDDHHPITKADDGGPPPTSGSGKTEPLPTSKEKMLEATAGSPKEEWIRPSREDAAKTAAELMEDITKTVEDIFPALVSEIAGGMERQEMEDGDAVVAGTRESVAGTPKSEVGTDRSETDISEAVPTETDVERVLKDAALSLQETIKPPLKVTNGVAGQFGDASEVVVSLPGEKREGVEKDHRATDAQAKILPTVPPSAQGNTASVAVDVPEDGDTVDFLTGDPKTGIHRTDEEKSTANNLLSHIGLAKTAETDFSDVHREAEKVQEIDTEKRSDEDGMSEVPVAVTNEVTGDAVEDKQPTGNEPDSKPRVIFRIDSEEELLSDAETEAIPPASAPSSPPGKLTEKVKQELKQALEQEQVKLEERLTTLKGGIFDISDESLSKTKELVDERLRKISEIKPPDEVEEKPPGPQKEVKIGRFHITPALVEEVVSRGREQEIAERLKTARTSEEPHDEVEKELPEKLTEADLEEVIRELKKEGLKTDVYLQPAEEGEKEEKKERTLKRVERRFERMASETLEKDIEEEGISEEKLNEKREIEFQRMVSNLSSDEVAEYQKEYLQLWEEGGLSSLTPTEDWESRDPDTPENELDDDSPRKSESFQGSHGTGKPGEPIKSSEPKKLLKSPPASPPKPPKFSDDISPKAQPLTPVDLSHVGSSPSEIDHSSGFVSERSDDIPTYSERKKFWEQMSSSQSSENAGELQRSSMIESNSSAESVEVDKTKDGQDKMAASRVAKHKFEPEEGTTVKSLTESFSKKISAGELIMPAVPRPKSSASREGLEAEATSDVHKVPDSSDTALVSELELKLKSRDSGAPITEEAVVSGSTEVEEQQQQSEKTSAGVSELPEDEAPLPLKERKKVFEESLRKGSSPTVSRGKPAPELPVGVKIKEEYSEEETIQETVSRAEEELPAGGVEDAAMAELSHKGPEETKAVPTSLNLKETHLEKSETEDSEKEKGVAGQKGKKREEEVVPSITVTTSGKRQGETGSVGESEDTQSESDVTPEDARVVDNGDAHWDGGGSHSGGFSPKDDMDYPKEIGEAGIGRWMGQEDLSKQSWEKDELESAHFRIRTKWERTRSEGASPKDHYVCTPEEHYPDTVWEVPVQEQLEKEEMTHEIPIEKQVIIEKDEDEYEEEEEPKVKLTEEEAKEIAEEVLEYIQFEVENRSSFLTNDSEETPEGLSQAQVTDYLRHLTEGKDFDDQDVQLIESILVKKQRDQLWKSQSVETTGCSVDITDEELRSTGVDDDISPVDSQIAKLQNLEEEEFPGMSFKESDDDDDDAQRLKDVEMLDRTLAEVKESLGAAQEQLIEQQRKRAKSEIVKKESPSEFELKGMSSERKIPEKRDVKPEETTPGGEGKKISKETLKEETLTKKSHEEELIYSESEKEKLSEKLSKDSSEEEKKLSHHVEATAETGDLFEKDIKTTEKTEFDKTTKTAQEIVKKVETEGGRTEQVDLHAEDREFSEQDMVVHRFQTSTTGEEVLREKKTVKVSSRVSETSKSESKIHKAVVEEPKTVEAASVPESMVVRRVGEQAYASEESPRSGSTEESMKSPPGAEDILSSASSTDRQVDKSDILFRHSSSFLRADRRSGADLEPYSSSGESHYHSFEQTSSRPCSSDVEVLLGGNVGTTGSSEYESAVSSSKQPTSTEYQTAVSSLSSRESIRSLDSESSGHLGSVEVSSEASETLIPSALELDRDLEAPGAVTLDDDVYRGAVDRGRSERAAVVATDRAAEEDFEIISESEVASLAGGVSEEEDGAVLTGEEAEEHAQKMKRSYEMTFQPEPKPIAFFDSMDGLPKDAYLEKPPGSIEESCSTMSVPDEKFGSSLEESGSVLSMSLSTTSEPSAMRTVIELSHTDSLTVSATSLESREEMDSATPQQQSLTNEVSTSTSAPGSRKASASVTITTSSSDVQGVPCVSTQVTSVSRKSSMVDDGKSESDSREEDSKCSSVPHANGPTQVEYVPDYDEVETTTKSKKPQGHRRKESTSGFVPGMMWNLSEARTQKVRGDITETYEEYSGDKYVYDANLTEKEVKNDEKKEADDSEGFEQGLERKVSEGEEVEESKDYDNNRPQSQTSRTDSDSGRRQVSSVFSEDQPDSELSDLMKQGSSETEKEDPLERPLSPEPEETENKNITPELSSEAQASVTELEMEYSGAYSRRDEYASEVSPIREEKPGAAAEEHLEEEEEEGGVVADGLHSQTSLESTVAEKHELETGEKEILQRKPEMKELPDITVTEHVTPVSDRKFQYPDTKEEAKEKKSASKTPETPASTSSRTSSSSTDQGKEYNLDEVEIKKIPKETVSEEKGVCETKDEKESLDSPSSDSFEMLDKPDITDEFVIIEEVGREAQENDQEGKSIKIASGDKKPSKRATTEEEVIMSPPSPATKMTELKYYPSEEDADLFLLDSDSPPQGGTRKFAEKLKRRPSKEEEYDQQIEQSKKWVEMQFQGEQAAKIIGAYGYEMEFERAPLEDIKEEDLNELDSSSKMGSMGSQKESLGSFGSVKDSFSSTPDFDVLAGRKYFTRSGDHDDVSMSSLQEFELIEKKLMENGKKSGSSSSQDSLNSRKLGTSSKSGQGDDVSTGSLKEFETLESACATVVNMEKKAKQEEAILSEIDEGHESQISESESCETVSAVVKDKLEFDSEDFDKKMFEIDEIIRQAQSNVEKFSEMQALEKIESIGRGDSYEEVAKVPDLELDLPLSKHGRGGGSYSTPYSTQVVTKKKIDEWRASAETTGQQKVGLVCAAKQSELLENGGKVKSISADSLEIPTQEKKTILEGKEETISLDSYRRKREKSDPFGEMAPHKSDSMEEVRQHDSSSGEYTLSGTDHRPPPRAEFMLGSTDSLDPSSSTATHATYQYETDSVMSSSFTSGDSNTMVSSTDNLDLLVSGQSVIDLSKDLGISKADDWLENLEVGGGDPLQKPLPFRPRARSEVQKFEFRGADAERAFQEFVQGLGPREEVIEKEEVDEDGNVHVKKVVKQRVVIRTGDARQKNPTTVQQEKVAVERSQPFVSETVEPLRDEVYSHVVHRRVQMEPEVEKITFRGPEAEQALKRYVESLGVGEEVEETEEVDEHGNIVRKKVIRERVVVRPGEETQGEDKVGRVGEDGGGGVERVLVGEKSGGTGDEVADEMEIVDVGPQLQKIIIKGPNAERTLEEYRKSLNPEDDVLEMEEVDEHGNVHVKKVLRQRILVRPNKELTEEELQQYLNRLVESESLEGEGYAHVVEKTVEVPAEIEKVSFRGPDAEKQFQEFIRQQQQQQPEVEEIQEVDEHGNTHIKRIIRQRVVVRPPDRELTKAELEEYLNRLEEPEPGVDTPAEVQKVTFRGPDAEKQFQEFIRQQQQPEVEEIQEVDEHGNTHIKRIIRQRVVVRPPDRELTKAELEEYLNRLEEPGEGLSTVTETGVDMPTQVQKITFRGPDAEKQFQEFIRQQQQQQPEVEEIQEVDEHGNTHIKRILRQRVVVRPPDRELTKAELEEYLNRLEEPEPGVGTPAEVQKVTFRGPDAEKQFQEFIRQQQHQPEVEEIQEVDEHGNVLIKRIIKQRVVIRSGESAGEFSGKGANKQGRMLTKDELERYLDQLEESEAPEFQGGHVKGPSAIQKPEESQELSERLLTEEEFQERLRRRQTGFHREDVDIGSTEPFVSEIIEPLDEEGFSHVIHRKVQMAPEVQKVVFRGPEAERAMKAYLEGLNPGEELEEMEEVDEHGNVHVKRILRRKMVMKPEDLERTGLKGEELKSYLKRFELEHFEGGQGPPHVHSPRDPDTSASPILTQGFSSSVVLTDKEGRLEEEEKAKSDSSAGKESGISQRPPLVSDISMDDEAEYDPTEHDWRHQLEILHAEADEEEEIDQNLDAALAASFTSQKKE